MEPKKTPAQIKEQIEKIEDAPEVLLKGDSSYDEHRNSFNLKFNVYPAVIAFCKTTKQAQHVVKVAMDNRDEYDLRVRSGAHDHEGECTETGAIVIDFSKMKTFDIDENKVVRIDSGIIFKDVIAFLDANNVSIPHGTCETVGAMGFTLGGGWGPWTRHKGMCCEHLVGATMIDAKGEIRNLHIDNEGDKELIWALRGGGGYTFGILTELFIQTFPQPKHTLRFTASWKTLFGGRKMPAAIQVLDHWEQAIAPGTNKNLLGTNLQIFGNPANSLPIEESIHEMNFYGYYGTDSDDILNELARDMDKWFPGDLSPLTITIITTDKNKKGGKDEHNYNFEDFEDKFNHLQTSPENFLNFGRWERESHVLSKMIAAKEDIPDALGHFPPDVDAKAPHKLSSKMVQQEGLGEAGRKNLINSLRSKHIVDRTQAAHVHTYVTLGAISGNFYGSDFVKPSFPEGVSFPFQKRPYTIQYQVWWNESEEDKAHYDAEKVKEALAWIANARDTEFPQTNGAFISFKDAEIPIETYFLENYDKLHEIKQREDETNFFGSKTTIKA